MSWEGVKSTCDASTRMRTFVRVTGWGWGVVSVAKPEGLPEGLPEGCQRGVRGVSALKVAEGGGVSGGAGGQGSGLQGSERVSVESVRGGEVWWYNWRQDGKWR